MKRIIVALVVLAVAAPSTVARAQDKEDPAKVEEARRFFDAGRQAYEGGQYLVAITAFEEALRLSPRPPVIFSLAQAYRRQYFVDKDPAKLKRALDLYKQYIVEVKQGGRRDDAVQYIAELEPMLARIEEEQRKKGMGPVEAMQAPRSEGTQLMISSRVKEARATIDGGEAGEVPLIRDVKPGPHKIRVEAAGYFPEEVEGVAVEGRLVVIEVPLREMPAKLTVRGTAGAEIAVDGRPVGTAPTTRPIEIPAGKHFVSVTKRGHYPVTREINVKRGETLSLDAPLERTTQRVASYWVLGGAGLLLLGGGTTTTLAFVHQGNAEDILDRKSQGQITQEDLDEYNRQREKRDDYVRASYFLYGGAVALAATGALLYFVDNPRVEGGPGASGGSTVVPAASAGFVGAVWIGTF
jgi:tetratricopeptide (TPR) repeat protein